MLSLHGLGMNRIELGRLGEEVAAQRLQACGLTVVDRNWRCAAGELDIVARDVGRDIVVFCEVKCRSGTGFGEPLEAITAVKLRRLRQLAGHWLDAHPEPVRQIRLDAIGVLFAGAGPQVRHVRGIG